MINRMPSVMPQRHYIGAFFILFIYLFYFIFIFIYLFIYFFFFAPMRQVAITVYPVLYVIHSG